MVNLALWTSKLVHTTLTCLSMPGGTQFVELIDHVPWWSVLSAAPESSVTVQVTGLLGSKFNTFSGAVP